MLEIFQEVVFSHRTASGEVGSLDYREKAPLSAYEKMYLDENGDVILKKVLWVD